MGYHIGNDTSVDELTLYHFNDVYHISQPQILARFSHALRIPKSGTIEVNRPVTVFSGDAFSPSLESAVLKGEHMIPVLNHLLVDIACYGNHDFDFGEDVLVRLSKHCTFPWLLANMVHPDGRLVASAQEHLIIHRKGYKIGFLGLAGTDWPTNCQHLPVGSRILHPVSVGQRVSQRLRSEFGADFVVALTHMRLEEDIELANECGTDIDLILGGHDHDLVVHGTQVTTVNGSFKGQIKIVKSGMDFGSYSTVQLNVTRKENKAAILSVEVHQTRDILLPERHVEDADIQSIISSIQSRIATLVDQPVLYTSVPLDGRSGIIRTKETNLGNMVADAVRAYYHADIALINSGGLRCNRIIPAGVVTAKDLVDVLPFDNPFVVKLLHGRTLLAALENSVSDIIDGRFFQVSGLNIIIDPQQPVGSRVLRAYLANHHSSIPPSALGHHTATLSLPLDPDAQYTVAMVNFIAEGFDGYTVFRDAPTPVGVEGAMTDTALLLQVFQGKIHAHPGAGGAGGATTPPTEPNSENQDETDTAIGRARTVLVVGQIPSGLSIVHPEVQSRISSVNLCHQDLTTSNEGRSTQALPNTTTAHDSSLQY